MKRTQTLSERVEQGLSRRQWSVRAMLRAGHCPADKIVAYEQQVSNLRHGNRLVLTADVMAIVAKAFRWRVK